MTRLFGRDKSVISRHIKNIFAEEELNRDEVVAKIATTTKHEPMRMKDYINQLDKILNSLDANVLNDAGSISHKKAIEKAKLEYEKYQIKELTAIEKEYLNSINKINKIADKLNKD